MDSQPPHQAVFHLSSGLILFLAPERRKNPVIQNFRGNPALKHLVEALGVPHTEVKIALVNGKLVDLGYHVADGDQVSLFSQVDNEALFPLPAHPEGIDAQDPPRFILDNHLGRLAAYLRMLGFDTLYHNDYNDVELAETAARENRVLLTRDRRLLMRSLVTRGAHIRHDQPREQIREVMERFGLARWVNPFHRCLRCNQVLESVRKEQIVDQLEPLTRKYYDEFHRCPDCGQVYWKGSHYERMLRLVQSVMEAGGEQSQ
jgi:hypothetical protein